MRWLCHDDTATFFWFVGVESGFCVGKRAWYLVW